MSDDRVARPWDLLNPSIQKVEKPLSELRLEICATCENFIEITKQCKKCGCLMAFKTKLPHAECPIGKWGKSES